ncbi:MAG: transposase [Candidatus Paceibacterota bacterium]|jgi:REP element-mobilizing transposase RayT
MSQRKVAFAIGEYYHVFNRGIEGRSIFANDEDLNHFIQSVEKFNDNNVVGGLYMSSFDKYKKKGKRLVNIICYAFNPNHYHFLMTPLVEKGIENFMQRLGTGHTMFFNHQHKRKGRLFQGVFKSAHIDSNEYLMHLSVYINLNDKVHQLRGEASKLAKTSWNSYASKKRDILLRDISIITNQFKNPKEYKKFAEEILPDIIERKQLLKELEAIIIEEE